MTELSSACSASASLDSRSGPLTSGTSIVVISSVMATPKTPSLKASARENSTSRSSRSNCLGGELTARMLTSHPAARRGSQVPRASQLKPRTAK